MAVALVGGGVHTEMGPGMGLLEPADRWTGSGDAAEGCLRRGADVWPV